MRNEVAEHVDVGLVEHLSIPITVAGQALDTEAALHRALEPDLRLEFALQQLATVAMGDVEVGRPPGAGDRRALVAAPGAAAAEQRLVETGRAAWGERGGQYVENPVG